MEELTIEQKAKRYDESIKIAKSKINNDKDHLLYEEDIIEIFPELKEKTDKEMIQKLISVVHLYYGEGVDEERDACLKWLDKQKVKPYTGTSFLYNNHTWGICARDDGVDILCDSKLIKHIEYPQGKTILENLSEQKQEWSKEDENEFNHILKILNLVAKEQENKGYNNLISSANWLKSIKDRIQSKPRKKNIEQNLAKKYGITGIGSKHAEGKLGEMIKKKIETENVDNANKVEPKFHKGDWIISKYMHLVMQILNNDNGSYKTVETDGTERNDSYDFIERNFDLWNINDAVAGDILTDESDNPFIYCGHDPSYWKYLTAYCGISLGEFIVHDKPTLWTNDTVEPAAKEQRDLLFTKMKENGYEWDSEKKELKKM